MGAEAKMSDWVHIGRMVLLPEKRIARLLENTQRVALETVINGYSIADPLLGETVTIETIACRSVEGVLVAINPPMVRLSRRQ